MASKDEWKGPMGERWARSLEPHERMMAESGAAAMDALGDVTGLRVLDLGCGGGRTTFALAERAGPEGAATGLDVSAPLLERARARHEEAGDDPRISFAEADAAEWAAPAPFDALYSRCGAMFFEDEPAAYAHLRAQMRPGAPMALLVWAERERCLWGSLAPRVLEDLLGPLNAPGGETPGPFRWGRVEPKLAMLAAAGWTAPMARRLDHETPLSYGEDLDPLIRGVEHVFHGGPAARPLAQLSPEKQAEARARLFEALAPYVKGEYVRLPASAWIVTATA